VPYLAEQGAQDHGSDTGERHTGQTRPSVGAAGEGEAGTTSASEVAKPETCGRTPFGLPK
jgi:hypothetical protein